MGTATVIGVDGVLSRTVTDVPADDGVTPVILRIAVELSALESDTLAIESGPAAML